MIRSCSTTTRVSGLSLFLAVLLAFGAVPAKAQMGGGVTIEPGVRVGFNSASFGGDTEEFAEAFAEIGLDGDLDTGRRSGFTVGGFALFDFGGAFALQPGVRYIQRGYGLDISVSFGGETETAEGTLNFAYIDIPILARYTFATGGSVSPFILAGPNVGFNVTAESEFEAGDESNTEDISDEVSSTDLGVELGGGIDYPLSGGTVTVDVRYGLGFTNVVDADDTDISLTNRALMVTAGFRF